MLLFHFNFPYHMNLNEALPIELTSKPIFTQYFKDYPPEISEFTFTNLFAWQEHYNLLFMEWRDHLLIFSKDFLGKWKASQRRVNNPLFFFPPVGESPEIVIIELFKKYKSLEIHRADEPIISKLQSTPDFSELNLKIIEDRDNWDYVYDKSELIDLAGNKYRSKRRQLEKFLEHYKYEFYLISEEWLESCKNFQEKWCLINECQKNKDLQEEQNAIERLFNNYTELDYNGGILLVDDNTAGYTIGEMLNKNTNVIHIEKAHVYYQGSYQTINNFFLKECCSQDAEFVNREQDLGIEGLRKAKQSYHPHHMVKKYIIYQDSK
ncbi:MAG: DUF2156 domain-containing protein [Candidatus Lokiarchaeota archaeon]|nr:DUF2156 domain-containing protein [Candidatus Lokiarchaeota archaeon]